MKYIILILNWRETPVSSNVRNIWEISLENICFLWIEENYSPIILWHDCVTTENVIYSFCFYVVIILLNWIHNPLIFFVEFFFSQNFKPKNLSIYSTLLSKKKRILNAYIL